MIHLLFGPNELLRTEAVGALVKTFPDDVADLNIAQIDGKRLRADSLAAACEALPFLYDRRMVIVIDALKSLKAGKERDEVIAYLPKVPAQCDLVFVEREDVDRRSAFYNALKKSAQIHEFPLLEGPELLRWIDERTKMYGARIDPQAAQRLAEYIGGDARALSNELSKLASYVGRRSAIDLSAVDRMVQDGQEQNLFAFIDDLSARRRGAALRGARALLEEGQAATYIIFMLARQIRILIAVRDLAQQRMRPDAIAAELGQKPFVVRKAMDQARAFAPGELETIHDRLLEYDHASKTGRINAEVALELLVAEICK